jgi:4'-phosphopantetheinyl transferase
MAGPGILRSLLGAYLDVEPENLQFSYGPFGKPFLLGGWSESPVHFNVSHACGRALYAFSRDQEIGVDLERIQTNFDFVRLANSFFPTVEITRLHSYAAAQRLPEFFRIWTRLEACGKACGLGLSILDSDATVLPLGTLGTFILSQDISQLSLRKAIR